MALDDSYAARVRRALAQQVPEVVPAADAARLAGLGVALALQSAQQVTLTLNRGRNVAKYGPASSQVADMDARLAANAQMTQALQEAQVRAQRQAPTVPDGAAAVFGGVVDADGTGIAKAIVVAMNAAGAPAARAESAADGSYQLIVPVSANSSTGLALRGVAVQAHSQRLRRIAPRRRPLGAALLQHVRQFVPHECARGCRLGEHHHVLDGEGAGAEPQARFARGAAGVDLERSRRQPEFPRHGLDVRRRGRGRRARVLDDAGDVDWRPCLPMVDRGRLACRRLRS